MTDIVERLRNCAQFLPTTPDGRNQVSAALLTEAADTIEQLRSDTKKDVREIKDLYMQVEQLRSLGIAAVGPSFAELMKDARRDIPSNEPSPLSNHIA